MTLEQAANEVVLKMTQFLEKIDLEEDHIDNSRQQLEAITEEVETDWSSLQERAEELLSLIHI